MFTKALLLGEASLLVGMQEVTCWAKKDLKLAEAYNYEFQIL